MINEILNWWKKIKVNLIPFSLALLFSLILIKPMFQISILTGVLYIFTCLYVFLIKPELFIKYPGYSFIIFIILAIRWGIGDVRVKGLNFLDSGEIVSGIIYLIVWILIYIKTKEMQRH